MGDFERQHLTNLPNDQQNLWFGWDISMTSLPSGHMGMTPLQFNSWLNSRQQKIQFTCTHCKTSYFLDTTVKLVDGSLQTELFIKPTSSLSYLHRDSCHPTHVFQSLPYGEFLRVRRNCSTLSSFNHFSDIILEAILGTSDITRDLYQLDLTSGARWNPRLRDLLVRSSIPLKPTLGKKGKSKNVCHTAHCKYCANIDTSGLTKSKQEHVGDV